MTAGTSEMTTELLDAGGMRGIRTELLRVYADAYADKIDLPFFTAERFWERLEAYTARDGFVLVTGRERATGELVGYALGYTLPDQSRWWSGLIETVDADLLAEDGQRTFALNYIMTVHAWRRRGIARTLHDSLVASRSEQRATLLVLPQNVAAVSAYLNWGWYKLGTLKPFEDAPTYDAMILDLSGR